MKKNVIYGICFLFFGLTVLTISIFLLFPRDNFFDDLMSDTPSPSPTHTLSSPAPTVEPTPTIPPEDEGDNGSDIPSDGEGDNGNDTPSDGGDNSGNDTPSDGGDNSGNDTPSDGGDNSGNDTPSDGGDNSGNDTPSDGGDNSGNDTPSDGGDNSGNDTPSDGGNNSGNDTPSDGGNNSGNDTPSDGGNNSGNDTPSDGGDNSGNDTPSDGGNNSGNDTPSDGGNNSGNDTPSDGGNNSGNDTPSDGGDNSGNDTPSDGGNNNGNNTPSEGETLQPGLKPAQITVLRPVASNVLTKSNQYVVIDYSNAEDGYVMVRFVEPTSVRLKVQVIGPTTSYTYNLTPLEWTVFPLSDGNGAYQVKVFRNVVDNRYATVLALSFSVTLADEFAPFLRPNQYVNYENATKTIQKTSEIIAGKNGRLEKAEAIYQYVVSNISYDYDKLDDLESTYLPDLDQVLAKKKGICFDYAALMTSMLRVSDIPCKLVVGYAGTVYHAWISVWSPEEGWIDGVIFFDGSNWQHMDPTFAASGAADRIASVNYTTKYIY